MLTEVSIVEVGARPLAVVRVEAKLAEWPRQAIATLDKVYAAIKAGQVRQNGPNVMVYRPRADFSAEIECGVETAEKFDPVGEVFYAESPTGTAATATHIGSYGQLGESHQKLMRWIGENGHQFGGICWEVYGDWEEDESKLRTDLFYLLLR